MTPRQLLQLLLGRAFWLNQVCQVLLVPSMGSLPKATPLPDGLPWEGGLPRGSIWVSESSEQGPAQLSCVRWAPPS